MATPVVTTWAEQVAELGAECEPIPASPATVAAQVAALHPALVGALLAPMVQALTSFQARAETAGVTRAQRALVLFLAMNGRTLFARWLQDPSDDMAPEHPEAAAALDALGL